MGASGEAGRGEARLSAALARFFAESRWEDIPPPMRHEARRALLNVAGCILAGRREPAVELLAKALGRELLSDAVVLGAAANALDFDDTHVPTVIHPGPPVGGALFALAQYRAMSGRELLHAYILGVEAACRIGNAVSPGHYQHGWHITATCGVFGAAVAAAAILHLDEKRLHCALALAATQACGLVEMLGSAARALNPGFAARNGIAAALIAEQGIETPERALEGRRGFINVFGVAQDPSVLTAGLGETWELARVAYKPYPAGVVLHALIDACLKLRSPREPQKIAVKLHPLAIERGDRPEPRDGVEARLSAQHCAAVALVYGAAGVAQFSDAVVADPAVRRARARVTLAPEERLDPMATIVNIDGREVHAELRQTMSDAELEAKFRALAGARAERWQRFMDGLESQERVSLPEQP